MKKFLVCALVVGFSYGITASPAFAIKQFGEAWGEFYVKDSKNEEFKKAASEAKCTVCHLEESKKKHNAYGMEVKNLLKKKDFPVDRFKSDAAKCKAEIEAAFKKVEDVKAKDGKTYGEKIKAGQLPASDGK